MNDFDTFIEEVTSRAQRIADGSGVPGELGIEILDLAIRTDDEVRAVGRPLLLIFGALTDPVDWPGNEAEIPVAQAEIRRAAAEWLVVAHDPDARHMYLDRWLQETGTDDESSARRRR